MPLPEKEKLRPNENFEGVRWTQVRTMVYGSCRS